MKKNMLIAALVVIGGFSLVQAMEEDISLLEGYSKICVPGYPIPYGKVKSPFENGAFTYYFVPGEFQIREIGKQGQHCFVLLSPEKEVYVDEWLARLYGADGASWVLDDIIDDLEKEASGPIPMFGGPGAEAYLAGRQDKEVLLQVFKDLSNAGLHDIVQVIEYLKDMKTR